MTDDRTTIGDVWNVVADERQTDGMIVELAGDHPGVADPDYRQRRDTIAAAALGLEPGEEARDIEYTSAETETWVTAASALRALHVGLACRPYLDGAERLDLPTEAVPQLAEVSRRLQRLTGWRFHASPGLAPIREFYGALAERRFLSTQYVRHPSVPLYTPEPDVIHELVGHANGLAEPRFADLYAVAGAAGRRRRARRRDRLAAVLADVLVHARVRRRPSRMAS